MNTETINHIKELLAPVALKIGQTADWGWTVVLKQQYVIASIGLLQMLCGLALIYPAYYLTRLCWKNDWEIGGMLIPFLSAILVAFLFFVGSYDAITHFINPEYYAIQFFIGLAN